MIKKIISLMLTFLFLFQVFPNANALFNNEIARTDFAEFDLLSERIVREIIENREEKAKYFELDNGQIMKVDYTIAVHKRDQNGNWQDIFGENRKNFIKFDKNLVRIFRENYEISVSYENSLDSEFVEIDENYKVYKNVYENVDLEYKILQNQLEENLVLNSKDAPKDFLVSYSLKGLTANQIDEKNVELLNENQKCVYTISVPKMIDSKNQICENLILQVLENQDDKLKIKIVCDKDWIESKERVFPILVDPDYKDENFDFTSDDDGKILSTNWRKKDTNTSVFLNLNGSDFKDFGVVTVSIFGRGPNGEMNCTYQAEYYLLEAGKKYELYNLVNEKGCTDVQIRFRSLQGQIIRGKWSPDYSPEPGVLRIGDASGSGNVSDTTFSLVVSPSGTCWTKIRTKANDSSVYLQLFDPSGRGGSVKCSIWGFGGNQSSENCTYKQEYYTLQFGQKYELLNVVKEHKHSGAQLRLESDPGTRIQGKWSPDYVPESGCIRVPSKSDVEAFAAIRPIIYSQQPGFVELNVDQISQKAEGYSSGCEPASAVMVLNFYNCRVSVRDFISKYLDVKPVANSKGPDPNSVFAGNPAGNGYGCFAPVIARAMNKVLNGAKAEVIRGQTVAQLASTYVKNGTPVLVWATIGMKKPSLGNTWKINYVDENAVKKMGETYTWQTNEHCVVLIGFNEKDYFVNDPYQPLGRVKGAYEKNLFEQRFRDMGSQAVVVRKTVNPLSDVIVPTQPPTSFSDIISEAIQSVRIDGIEAHKMLQNYFQEIYGEKVGFKEVFIPAGVSFNKSGTGKVDLMLLNGSVGELYEIKTDRHHISYAMITTPEVWKDVVSEMVKDLDFKFNKATGKNLGRNQLDEYVKAANSSEEFKIKYGLTSVVSGTTFNPNGKILSRTSNPDRKVKYRTYYNQDDPGMIYWTYYVDKARKTRRGAAEEKALLMEKYLKDHGLQICMAVKKALEQGEDYITVAGQSILLADLFLALTVMVALAPVGI